MERVILVKYGEIALKGKNRHYFEDKLIRNLKSVLKGTGASVKKIYGRLVVSVEETDDDIINKVRSVFGVISVSPAVLVEPELEVIKEAALEIFQQTQGNTFKVIVKRPNKKFPMQSPEVSKELGGHLLINTYRKSVDLHHPDTQIFVEIRVEGVFVYSQGFPGYGGLPVGVTGKAVLMISGGIDSPVAGWLSMKRGVDIVALHFHSHPFTSERAKQKVLDLLQILSGYKGHIKVYVNPFTEMQKTIKKEVPKELYMTVMRRMMYRIAVRVAEEEKALGIVTGENLGQVASQTMESMHVINRVTSYPILRPLLTMDKVEIIDLAKKIGTYETSIQPYEDCCTLFLPERPATKPKLSKVLEAEQRFDYENLIGESLKAMEVIHINR